jgi:hypothetical protein
MRRILLMMTPLLLSHLFSISTRTPSRRRQLLVSNCDALPAAACYLERVGNLSGVRTGCASAASAVTAGGPALDARLYAGHYNRRAPAGQTEEFIAAYDLRDSDYGRLRAAVLYNDTTGFSGFTAASFTAVPSLLRLTAPVDALLRAFINARAAAAVPPPAPVAGEVVAGMVGLVEMPRTASFLSLDLGCHVPPCTAIPGSVSVAGRTRLGQ